MKILNNVDFGQNEIDNAVLQPLGTAPSSPFAGQFYFDTVALKTRQWTGSAWINYTIISTNTPTALTVGGVGAAGSGVNAAASDHAHAMPSLVTTSVDGFMSAADKTKLNGIATGATNTPLASTSPSTLTVGGAAAVGTGTTAARDDHVHAMPALATTSVSGFMSAADKTSLTNATSASTAGTLVLRDGSSNASFNVLTANSITITNAPSAGTDGVNKTYVDGLVNGYDWKASCRAASTANVLVSNPGTAIFDGVTLSTGDRLLLRNQTSGSENGIYVFNTSGTALTRATDSDTSAKMTANVTVWIEEGTTQADTAYTLTTNGPITLGSTSLTFTQTSGAGQITAGTGLSKTSNTLNANTSSASTGIDGSNNIIVRSTATTGQVLRSTGSAGAEASWGALDLTSVNAITGTLGVGNGGTGQASLASGALLLGAGTTSPTTSLAPGANYTVLRIPSGGGSPAYGAIDLSQSAAVTGMAAAPNFASMYRQPVRVVATTNITISGPGASIDGVTLVAGDRILLVNQTTTSQNGLWVFVAAASAMTRPTDYAAGSTTLAYADLTVFVTQGTAAAGTFYRLTTTGAITIDTTTTAWAVYSLNANNFINAVKKFSTTGPGTTGTTFVVTHNLNTKDVTPTLRLVSSDAMVLADWVATDVNNVTFTFAQSQTLNTLRAVVQG